MTYAWLLLTAAFASVLAFGVAILYKELRHQNHIWQSPCITPAETRKEIVDVLRVFQQVLDGKGISWWVDYGTLLGAWRVNGPMAFDHDLDVSYLGEHEPKLRGCVEEFASRGVELKIERTSIFYRGRKLGDIEPWWPHGKRLCRDNPGQRVGVMKYWRPIVDDFPAHWITPFWQIRIDNAMYPCPNRPDRFLRHRYLTCRLHLRLVIPHKQKCWLCRAFWREAARIWRFRPMAIERGPMKSG